ncbi:hypothetical protein KO361_06255 [Candidatus Woesearchaeota archaeon]|nr:hypothetical protein [Candidatus Woesearchaeota archaeon]
MSDFFVKRYFLVFLLVFVLFISGCAFIFEDSVLYVFLNKNKVKGDFVNVSIDNLVFLGPIPDFVVRIGEVAYIDMSDFVVGDGLTFSVKSSDGFSFGVHENFVRIIGKEVGVWRTNVRIYDNNKLYVSNDFDVVVLDRFVDIGEADRFKEMVEEENSLVSKIVSFFSSSSSSSSSVVEEEDFCRFYRLISSEEEDFLEEVLVYDNISKIVSFINSNFSVVDSDIFNLSKPVDVYNAREGSEYELLRLFFLIAVRNCYSGQLVVYEYNVSEEDKGYGAVVFFRGLGYLEEVDEPRYFYYEDGEFKVNHYGWSYNEFMLLEDERNDIFIERIGYLSDYDSLSNKESYLLDVYEWGSREEYDNY